MADPELIQERLISGRGVLKVPSDVKKNRYTVLYLDVIRQPVNKYANLNWNPARGRYAQLVFLRKDYVIGTRAMEFPREAYDGVADIAGQTLIAVKCAYAGILQTFTNFANALSLPVISVTNLIEEYENLRLGWDEVRIICYADTAIQARLYKIPYDVCNPDYDDQQEPPPPPPPRPPVPPGTPIADISDPYEGDNDGGDTVPFPGDDFPPPPIPDCTVVTITIDYQRLLDGSTSPQRLVVLGQAPVDDVYIDEVVSGGSSIFVVDRGGPPAPCSPTPITRRVDRGLGIFSDLTYTVTET